MSNVPPPDGGQADEKEIISLVIKIKNDRCEESFRQLREYLNSYITLFERKYRIPGCDADEIEQECLFALRFKAIEDFNPTRGKFRSFAILCMKRHLFSIIKASSQQKRRVLNESLSLDEDRGENGNNDLSLNNLVSKEEPPDDLERTECNDLLINQLMSQLSKLEQEVFKLYVAQNSYQEIADELSKIFPTRKKIERKVVDNSLVRLKLKAQNMGINLDFW
jgi:RNA polymerase sporulation-specific sigma factor